MTNKIQLDFNSFILNAELFNTKIAEAFYSNLPYDIDLTLWGNEAYGSIGINLGEENPVPEIPAGGLAYTNQGNYFCIFFGQKPAWDVEYIGKIEGDGWKKLIENSSINKVKVSEIK